MATREKLLMQKIKKREKIKKQLTQAKNNKNLKPMPSKQIQI